MPKARTKEQRARDYHMLRDKFKPGERIAVVFIEKKEVIDNLPYSFFRKKRYQHDAMIVPAVVASAANNKIIIEAVMSANKIRYDNLIVDIAGERMHVKASNCFSTEQQAVTWLNNYAKSHRIFIHTINYCSHEDR